MSVVPFKPENGQKLENIPHMLRYWADELEAGREPMPETALLVLMGGGDEVPDLCIFGNNTTRINLVGALTVLAQTVGDTMA